MVKATIDTLIKTFNTRNPITIADGLGYIIIQTPLSSIRGFYQYLKRCHIIYIDNTLDEPTSKFVCAHELGHSILHNDLNRLFLDTRTHFVSSRYEKEADRFAVDLLFDDYELHDFLPMPIEYAANYMGVSLELAEYRMMEVVDRM